MRTVELSARVTVRVLPTGMADWIDRVPRSMMSP